ncbi:methyl-accepting chemotaxis protein [Massilia sp. KIM]|uniref:methyl-accepting chemotaxis protein n=1 Tax=Massilia sp. KIM TaxID=1955422 RepID=UPI00098E8CF5|nr:methyl-accepting chemotaxis protein [Massilia sp. KIM]
MNRISIGARLAIGFSIVLFLLLLETFVSGLRYSTARDVADDLINTNVKNQRNIAEWSKYIELNSAMIETAFVSPDPNVTRAIADRMKAVSARSTTLQKEIEASVTHPGVRAQLTVVGQERKKYLAARSALFEAKIAGDSLTATDIYTQQMVPRSASFLEAMKKLLSLQIAVADNAAKELLDGYARTKVLLYAFGVAALFVGCLIAWSITRSITVPISHAASVAERVASGDLTSQIVVSGRDETSKLLSALAGMNASLSNVVTQVRAGTATIATASREIASGNQDLASRTEQQAGVLEETSSAMEDLTAKVVENSTNSHIADELAREAASVALEGGQVVAEVISTMGSINQSSRKISEITKVIDGIAFQTNILALNASVEAARAGEQGRGFAVVASEVRGLAQRAATAAKEIKVLIDESVVDVERGSDQANRAGETMRTIVGSVERVTRIMAEIALASDEQRTGIEQVNRAISDIDRATQQNAALVEEAAAAAESMQGQAVELTELVSTFVTAADSALKNEGASLSHSAKKRIALQFDNL